MARERMGWEHVAPTNTVSVHTSTSQKLADNIAQVPSSEPGVILSTGGYAGEGFDDARLGTLFLAMPISWRGTLEQYVGRLHRLHENGREVQVFDYTDANVPMLARRRHHRYLRKLLADTSCEII